MLNFMRWGLIWVTTTFKPKVNEKNDNLQKKVGNYYKFSRRIDLKNIYFRIMVNSHNQAIVDLHKAPKKKIL